MRIDWLGPCPTCLNGELDVPAVPVKNFDVATCPECGEKGDIVVEADDCSYIDWGLE